MTDTETSAAWVEQDGAPEDAASWPLRPLMLAALGLVAGLVVHLLLGDEYLWRTTPSPQTLAAVALVTVTAGLTGFTIERRLWWASLAFSAACGVLAAAVVWWNGPIAGWSGGDGWRVACLALAIAIAAPLFQAARDAGAVRFPYSSVHDHAWTNIVLWGACWVFVGISFALTILLGQLFHLIKIDFLKDLLEKYWFCRALTGLAFGGALGLLREQTQVVRLLQRVVATVLAVLAPVLAVGLILFVLALPFTGLNALWDATSATTPILLSCVVGALILANAVIGDKAEHERNFPALKFGAMGLGLVVFPLAVIAAIAIGLRIGQYGFTPERLWALTFVVLATAYSFAYLVSLLRGRLHWAEQARPANLNLAFAVCGVALVLATPLVSFNAISTRDQVARLESGKLTPEKFDWRALAFDFGQPGRDALAKLRGSSNAIVKAKAGEAAKAQSRWDLRDTNILSERAFTGTFAVLPAGAALPEGLKTAILGELSVCEGDVLCRVYMQPDGRTAAAVGDGCLKLPPADRIDPAKKCPMGTAVAFVLRDGKWISSGDLNQPYGVVMTPEQERESLRKEREAIDNGNVQVRTITEQQLFIGDKAQGQPFKQP
jgi:hypothetical protein